MRAPSRSRRSRSSTRSKPRCVKTASGSRCPATSCSGWCGASPSRASWSAMSSAADGGGPADLDARAAVSGASGLRLGRDRGRRRDRRQRPEIQPAVRTRRPGGLRPTAAIDPHTADPSGHRRGAPNEQDGGQLRRSDRSAPGHVREADERPRSSMEDYYRLLLAARLDPPRHPVEAKRELARRCGGRASMAPRPAGRPRRGSISSTSGARSPRTFRGLRRSGEGAEGSTCRPCSRGSSGVSRSEARRLIEQGGVRVGGRAGRRRPRRPAGGRARRRGAPGG